MKKLLFIIPTLATGGTNSSLDSIYTLLKDKYDIKVFAISHQPHNHHYSFENALLPPSDILSLIYSNYDHQHGLKRFVAFWIKAIKKILHRIGIDIGILYGKLVVIKLEKKQRYDYVIGFQEGIATKLAALFHYTNKIAWIHCNYDYYLPQKYTEDEIYCVFQKIVCVSNYTASIFKNRYPSLSSKTIVIHNIINSNRILTLGNKPIDDKRFSTNKAIILTIGRFSSIKRFREIPVIASLLKESGLSFTWYILGPDEDNEECKLFVSNIEKFAVHNYVKWLGEKSNPYPYFKASHLYVCLSESEACPMVFLEAKAFGLPIVTTNFPTSYEFIENGINGLVSPINSIHNEIYRILNDKELYSSIRKESNIFSSNGEFYKNIENLL